MYCKFNKNVKMLYLTFFLNKIAQIVYTQNSSMCCDTIFFHAAFAYVRYNIFTLTLDRLYVGWSVGLSLFIHKFSYLFCTAGLRKFMFISTELNEWNFAVSGTRMLNPELMDWTSFNHLTVELKRGFWVHWINIQYWLVNMDTLF